MDAGPVDTFLHVEGVSKRFGPTQALDRVSVAMRAGEVHALMGENGAGKSTLGKIIAGVYRQDDGSVTLGGRRLVAGSLADAYDAGVRLVHQELAQCPNLTVAENLCLHDLPRNRFGFIDRRAMVRRASALLERIEPGIDPRAPLGSLSPGHRQIVQIAGALDEERAASSAHRARVIVFDEPTSSLSIAETERLLRIVRQLAAGGITAIYVSHRMGEIFASCDRVTVLRDGRFVATSRVADISESELVRQMIGRTLDASTRAPAPASAGEAPRLEARSIDSPGKLHAVSIRVAPGEVLGIGGLVGSGRSELLDALFGLDPGAAGDVLIDGRPVRRSARAMMGAGVGYVPEDRRLQGLFFQLGLDENITLPAMPALSRAGIRDRRAERRLVNERMQALQVRAASPRALPGSLSGGNQQKLLIARWMGRGTRVLLLDEPTRGIDVGTKAEIYRLIRAAAEAGTAVVLVSSEMPEFLLLSNRIAVLCDGRLTGELTGDSMTQENILRLATQEPAGV